MKPDNSAQDGSEFYRNCLLPTRLISTSSPFNSRQKFSQLIGDSVFAFDQSLIFTPQRKFNPTSSNASPLQFKSRLEVSGPLRKVGGASSILIHHELAYKPQISPLAIDCFD